MVIFEKKYDVIDLETGRLDPSIFTDEEIYREELDKIFGRAWVMAGLPATHQYPRSPYAVPQARYRPTPAASSPFTRVRGRFHCFHW